jgi:hypothetical protein
MSLAHVDLVGTSAVGRDASPVPRVGKRLDRSADAPTNDWAMFYGLLIVALVPAVFWTGAIWLVSRAFDMALSASSLGLIAGGITIFLTIVGSVVMAGD